MNPRAPYILQTTAATPEVQQHRHPDGEYAVSVWLGNGWRVRYPYRMKDEMTEEQWFQDARIRLELEK